MRQGHGVSFEKACSEKQWACECSEYKLAMWGSVNWCELSPWDGSQQWVLSPCVAWPDGTMVIIMPLCAGPWDSSQHWCKPGPLRQWSVECKLTLWDSDQATDELTW